MHLIIDGYGENLTKFTNLEFIYNTLDECPDKIGMTKILPPYVIRYTGKEPLDWGLSGFVLIAESHISIHTFPEHKFVNIDIFSCKSFELKEVIKYFKERFELKELKTKTIERGLEYHYPPDVKLSSTLLHSERMILSQTTST